MGLQLTDQWVWDFWLAQEGDLWHVFFLHAAKTPDDPDKRHFSARIGHAISPDLISWEVKGDALALGPAGDWDDMATWTGSVIAHPEGGWAMLYTGVSSSEQGLVQRIGLARSHDLYTWIKHPENPVIEADARWYEMLDTEIWFDQAWRDPWLLQDPDSGLFHAFITTRASKGDPRRRGVIGHAISSDLIDWDAGPPILAPEGFGYMEVPQVFLAEGHWHLLFSAPAWAQATRRPPHCTGTFHAVSDAIEGPYRERVPLLCDAVGSSYGGKVAETRAGSVLLAFSNLDGSGRFLGGIADPISVDIAADGSITLVESQLNPRS